MAFLALLLAVGPVPTPSLLSLREAAALAQATPPPQGSAAQQQPASKPETPPSQAKPSDDDFNLLAPEKKPDAAALAAQARIQSEARRRRTMLQLHQIGGFATLATMTATVVLGQLNYMDKYGGGGDFGTYKTAHSISAYTTAAVFTATGLLAFLAPNPFEKPLRVDTATMHKASMIVATAGMATQIILGIATAGKEGTLAQRDLALAHQIVGYTTLVATYTGFLVLTFE
ncbi:MAG: hypothetical protein ACJ79D_19410 [Myxococcales bacterium]